MTLRLPRLSEAQNPTITDHILLFKGLGREFQEFRYAAEVVLGDVDKALRITASDTTGLAGKAHSLSSRFQACRWVRSGSIQALRVRISYPWLVASKQIEASALLFDMDGTLVDSNATVERAWAFWAQRHGLNLTEVLAFSHGRPTLATMVHFGERFAQGREWQAEADELQQREQLELSATVPIAGAREVLAQMNSHSRWAVVTSAPRRLAELRIAAAGLPLPQVLVPADEITRGKPDPEGYLKAARLLGVSPKECVVFEDTPAGVEAGLEAGMKVIGLLTTVAAERLTTPYLIRNYFDLRIQETGGRFTIEFLAF